MDNEIAERISRNCLGGRPLPRSLEILWDHQPNTDQCPVCEDELSDVFYETTLITDLSWFDSWFDDSPNARAHKEVCEQIGFFAESFGRLLGYWWGADTPEPPVICLDKEGTYRWRGSVGDALLWIYDEQDEDQAEDFEYARDWLPDHDLDLGMSTELLPDLDELKNRLFSEYSGEPRRGHTLSATPADPDDAFTWLLRPATEVNVALASLIDKERDYYVWTDSAGIVRREEPDQYLWTDADGLVKNIRLPNRARVLGVGTGSSRTEVEQALGQPSEQQATQCKYLRAGRLIHFHFVDDVVSGTALRLIDPPPHQISG